MIGFLQYLWGIETNKNRLVAFLLPRFYSTYEELKQTKIMKPHAKLT